MSWNTGFDIGFSPLLLWKPSVPETDDRRQRNKTASAMRIAVARANGTDELRQGNRVNEARSGRCPETRQGGFAPLDPPAKAQPLQSIRLERLDGRGRM